CARQRITTVVALYYFDYW
nr:immunoglobulin heavy chain junction region [Mus musculus]